MNGGVSLRFAFPGLAKITPQDIPRHTRRPDDSRHAPGAHCALELRRAPTRPGRVYTRHHILTGENRATRGCKRTARPPRRVSHYTRDSARLVDASAKLAHPVGTVRDSWMQAQSSPTPSGTTYSQRFTSAVGSGPPVASLDGCCCCCSCYCCSLQGSTPPASSSSPSPASSLQAARGRSSCTPGRWSTCTAPTTRGPRQRPPRPPGP